MRFGCDGIFNDSFIANFPQSVPVKAFWKSVENWQIYRHEVVYYFSQTQRISQKHTFSALKLLAAWQEGNLACKDCCSNNFKILTHCLM